MNMHSEIKTPVPEAYAAPETRILTIRTECVLCQSQTEKTYEEDLF